MARKSSRVQRGRCAAPDAGRCALAAGETGVADAPAAPVTQPAADAPEQPATGGTDPAPAEPTPADPAPTTPIPQTTPAQPGASTPATETTTTPAHPAPATRPHVESSEAAAPTPSSAASEDPTPAPGAPVHDARPEPEPLDPLAAGAPDLATAGDDDWITAPALVPVAPPGREPAAPAAAGLPAALAAGPVLPAFALPTGRLRLPSLVSIATRRATTPGAQAAETARPPRPEVPQLMPISDETGPFAAGGTGTTGGGSAVAPLIQLAILLASLSLVPPRSRTRRVGLRDAHRLPGFQPVIAQPG